MAIFTRSNDMLKFHLKVKREEVLRFAGGKSLSQGEQVRLKERLKYGVLPIDGLCRREAAW
ncbi:MAG: hypothetical protein K2N98_09905, partial [Lachnospiraceae bacterium]|nr:hypothetical protein [Lachnospiraceae bacterium]